MHHIYTTDGFIVHSTPHGEAGKFLLIFTRDFGMIGATAQGIRLDKSKLRFHVQDYDYSHISIVKGKEVWRLTGAHEIDHVKIGKIHIRILKLLKRLLQGEEKNEKLFEIIHELYQSDISEADSEFVEIVTVLKILHALGYIKDDISYTVDHVKAHKTALIKEINEALKASHL